MINLFKLQLLKEFWEMKNNKIKLGLGILFNILLLLIFFRNFTNSDDSYIFFLTSLCVLLMIMTSFITIGDIVIYESENGTLDNFIMSPYNLTSIILSRVIIKNFSTIFKLMILLIVSFLFIDDIYNLNYLAFIIVAIIGNLGLYGIGFILATISLFSNEIKLIANIFRIIFIYILFKCNANIFIPFSYAKKILLDILLSGSQFNFSNYSFTFLCLFIFNSLIYFILGIYIFNSFENKIYPK